MSLLIPSERNSMKKPTSLGFLFGYKETITKTTPDGKTVFHMNFKEGMSKKFPNKLKHMKDFWSQEIVEGQYSDLFIHPEQYLRHVANEVAENEEDLSFNQEMFTNRRYCFSYPITFEQYNALNCFSMARLHMSMYERWENDEVLSTALTTSIGEAFKHDSRPILAIYNDYKEVSNTIYHQEIKMALAY